MNTKKFNILLNKEDVLNTYKSKKHGLKSLLKYDYWFPIKPTPQLAGIVADLMGDGHLQGNPKWRIDYTSKFDFELNRFNNEVFNLFGVCGKIRKCTTNKYNTKNLGINNKPLARLLYLIGVPSGAKVLKKFLIPKWILNDNILFARFVNRLISAEGSIDLKSRYIELRMQKSVDLIEDGVMFFTGIKDHLLKYYKIKSTRPFLTGRDNIRKDGIITKGIRLKIKNKDSLKQFRMFIGIEDPNKSVRLNKIIEN